jgi:hypothetical protein
MNPAPRRTVIELHRDAFSWHATFASSPDMPNGVPLPLPLTAAAQWDDVASYMLRRFPGSLIKTADARALAEHRRAVSCTEQ